MAWRRIGNKPLFEPMLTQFTDAYMRQSEEMIKMSFQRISLIAAAPGLCRTMTEIV